MARANQKDRGLYCRRNKAGQERWYVRISVNGRMETFADHGGFESKDEAEKFLQNARVDLRRGKFFPEEFKAGLRLPLSDLLAVDPKKPRTHPDAKNEKAYRDFWLDFAGHLDARALVPSLIDDAKHHLEQRELSPQTVLHYLKFLRRELNRAKRDELLDRTPFDKVPLKPVESLRERHYSLKERRKLYAALGPLWCEAAELAGITGLRWSEQFTLTRPMLTLAKGYVQLPHTKAGKPQIRFLNRRAQALIRRQLARHTSLWLYPNTTQTGPIEYHNFRNRIWKPACTTAGIENARWNDWRHTFGSDLTMQGHSDRTVARLMGHTSTQMVKRYAHLSDTHLRKAIEGLGTAKQLRTRTPSKTANRA